MRSTGRRRHRAVLLGLLCCGVVVASAGIALNPWQAEGAQAGAAASAAEEPSSPEPGAPPIASSHAAASRRGAVVVANAAVAAAPSDVPTLDAPVRSVSPAPAADPSPSATPTVAPASLIPGGVLLPNGAIDADAYRRTAAAMGTAAGIAYRFGNASAGKGTTSVVPRAADRVLRNTGRADSTFQIGTQDPSKNEYSSDQGQVGYLSTLAPRTSGVDTIETLAMGSGTFSFKPQKSWTMYGEGHPSPDLTGGGTAKCLAAMQAKPGRFVAQARAYAHGEATANSLAVFDNGIIAASGTNTARGSFCLRLPRQLHPTAISMTNGSEFALVTVWNTDRLRSELAVVALGGTQKRGDFWGYEWSELYPGLRNYGMPTYGKLVGTVVLPMAAATGVSAVSDQPFGQWLSAPNGANAQPSELTLSTEANRRTFISGANKDRFSRAGYAVVFSREEHKVAFVDLQPLFRSVIDGYFGSRSTFDAVRKNIGKGAAQWPYAFSFAPASRPVVVKTVTTAQAPTAVAGMLSGAATPRAYVATADGKLHVFAVGGLASVAKADAGAIVEQGVIGVGTNPTGITYVKDRPNSTAGLDSTLIVTSRGGRSVQWVALRGTSGKVVRTLHDSRLKDPIAAEDNNTHGTESYVVSVADYGAGRLFNYRYGAVVFHTNGGARFAFGPGFQFGGGYDPKGKPFSISITNVT